MRAQRRTADILARLASSAARQHGLVTRTQAYQAGATWRWLDTHTGAADLTPVEADVFLLPGRPLTWEVEALAACLARGPSARLAFATAARIWSLVEGQATDRLHVVVLVGAHSRTNDRVQVHRTRRLDNSDVAIYGRLPVTTAARTIVDLARSLSPSQIERVVDDAIVRDLTSVPLLTGSLRRNGGPGRAGSGAVRAALAEWSAGSLESRPEVALARWLRQAGFPHPVRQYEIKRPGGSVARVDFAWPARRLVVEMDGYAHHHGPRTLAADHERRTDIAAQGWTVLTTTPGELRTGAPALRTALERLLT